MLQDLRYAARSLLRNPGFAAIAVLTLALGIGANTTIFTVVRSVLFRPLPYQAPERTAMLWNSWEGEARGRLSAPELFDYRQGVRSFEQIGAYAVGEANLTGEGAPERVPSAFMTADMFGVLGVGPTLGRAFTPEEDRPGGPEVVVLSHGLWQRRFGGDVAVIGRAIRVNGKPRTVLGVMPPEFKLPMDFREARPAQLFVPLALDPADPGNRGSHYLLGVGRLRPNATLDQARAEMGGVVQRWKDEGLIDWAPEFGAVPVRVAEELTGDVRPTLFILLAAVGLVLLIACANVANLLLARSDARRRELAVRAAIGAGRGRILRQLLTESLLLALVGGLAGVAMALFGVEGLVALAPEGMPRVESIRLDAAVLLFGGAIAVLTGLLFGVAPALQASRTDLARTLREGGRGATTGRVQQRFRSVLVVAEIALSVVLVIGAGLLIRSFWELRGTELGFQPEHVVTARISLPSADYPDEGDAAAFYRELTGRIEAIPGVSEVAAVRVLPLEGEIGDWGIDIAGKAEPADNTFKGDFQAATPGYIEAMGIKLVRGRTLEEGDQADALPVVVVNRTMAERYWPGEDPIGQQLRVGGPEQGRPWLTVVGIVEDVRHNAITEEPRTEMYLPHAQVPLSIGGPLGTMSLVIRTTRPAEAVFLRLREEVREMDPNLPVADLRTLEEVVSSALAEPRFIMLLLAAFAALALLLGAVGIYGVMSYAVGLRTQEFGIRMALGGRAGDVLRLVARQGASLAVTGIVIGVVAAFATTRLLASLLYGVDAADPWTFAAVPVLLLGIALLASYLPALRATRVDPAIALRAE